MLGYEWGNHSPPSQPPPSHQLIITDDTIHHPHHHHHQSSHNHHRPIFDDPYTTPCTFPHSNTPPFNQPIFSLYDSSPDSYGHLPQLTVEALQPAVAAGGFNHPLVPKPEQPEFPNRIGLNLGGRTYFAADDELMSRLYRRSDSTSRVVDHYNYNYNYNYNNNNAPKCQAEGCNADLTHAKHYHRRHKVCEFHSKAATVVAAGLTQRFCQQCSRFHQLSEFDNGKRSCRKRLADHNRRRRKSHQSTSAVAVNHGDLSQSDIPPESPSPLSIQRSTSDSGANSSSSVTVAISSPLGSFDSNFRQRSSDQ